MQTQIFPRCPADLGLGAGWTECVLPLDHGADHEFYFIRSPHCSSMAEKMNCVRSPGHTDWHVTPDHGSVHVWHDPIEEPDEEGENVEATPDPDAPGDLRRIMDRLYRAAEAQLVADRLRAELMEDLRLDEPLTKVLRELLPVVPTPPRIPDQYVTINSALRSGATLDQVTEGLRDAMMRRDAQY